MVLGTWVCVKIAIWSDVIVPMASQTFGLHSTFTHLLLIHILGQFIQSFFSTLHAP